MEGDFHPFFPSGDLIRAGGLQAWGPVDKLSHPTSWPPQAVQSSLQSPFPTNPACSEFVWSSWLLSMSRSSVLILFPLCKAEADFTRSSQLPPSVPF